jgi:hypothetical protein
VSSGLYLSEAFAKITAEADPAQFRDAADKAAAAIKDPTVTAVLGTDRAKAEAEKLKAQLDALFKNLGGSIKLDDKSAQLTFARMSASADRLQRKLSNEKISLDGIAKAQLDLLGLEVTADRLKSKLSGASGGAGSSGGLLSGVAGQLGGVSGGAGIALAAAPAIGALLVEVVGLLSGLAAAGAGVTAFGALAVPTFKKIATAYTGISAAQAKVLAAQQLEAADPTKANALAVTKALIGLKVAQDNLSPSTRTAVGGLHDLSAEYGKLVKAFAPDAMIIFDDGLKIANELLPDVMPFAKAASTALGGLLSQVGKFVQSPGFKAWLQQFETISGPAITAIGDGIGKVAIAVGKLLTVMSAKDVVHTINILFDTVAGTIGAVDYTVIHLMKNWDDMTTSFLHWAVNTSNAFKLVRDSVKGDLQALEIDALSVVQGILAAFSHVPFIGKDFHTAADQVGGELNRIRGDSARTWQQVQADMNALHGDTVSLNVKLSLPGGVSLGGHKLTGLARGTKGAAAGLAVVGEAGPELVRFRGGETVFSNSQSRKIMGYAAGTLDQFGSTWPNAAQIARATAALQAAMGQLQAPLQLNPGAFSFLAGAPPGSTGPGPLAAQAWMRAHMADYTWGANQWPSLLNLWNGESGWRWNAQNPTSPAYGIPQADPGSKMSVAGADWRTNPVTQMRWGAEYIRETPGYGDPAITYAKWLSRSPHWYGKGLNAMVSSPTLLGVGEHGPEHVSVTPVRPLRAGERAAAASTVTLEVKTGHGATDLDRALVAIIQKHVRVSGGGDVQAALGTAGYY